MSKASRSSLHSVWGYHRGKLRSNANLHVVASQNSRRVSLISAGDENWSLGKFVILTLSQASLTSETRQ